MKKAVLFDLDNTLYDYDRVHKIALKKVYNVLKKHINMTPNKFRLLFKLSRAEIHRELAGTASSHNRVLYFQRLIEKTHKTLEPNLILKLYNTYWDALLKNMKLRKGSLGLLKELRKRKIKVAIISDLTTNIQLRKLEKLRISKHVDVLVTSEESGSEKPHAIMFLLALNKLRVSPHEAIMVGDNLIADVEGANFVGLDTVLLGKKTLKIPKEDYRRPNRVIKNISEVIDVLDNYSM